MVDGQQGTLVSSFWCGLAQGEAKQLREHSKQLQEENERCPDLGMGCVPSICCLVCIKCGVCCSVLLKFHFSRVAGEF